ncbi:MAG: choline-sulfatase [Burkholderiales bacterium]
MSAATPPNIVLLMADQLTPFALPFHGHPHVRTPALSALAARGAVFDAAYCNFPICAPSRFSMLSGRMPHAIDAFDNASEFASEIPTMAHYLRAAGYRTILAGKMHFVGPDQLHGFDERLTTDIYPADFLWVPDWSQGPSHRPTGVGMGHVVDAGPCVRNMQIDYDEEVAHVAVQKIYDLARAPSAPFFLTVSFTHPHPPFVARQDEWDAYDGVAIDDPAVPPIPYAELDPHSQWLYVAHGQDRHTVTDAHVRNARRAYYAMVSYVDARIGSVLDALGRAGLARDAMIVFCSDHGEMLGERGMWYKQTFYESSVRVPLVMSGPGIPAGRRAQVCSLVDLLPTFLDVAAQAGHPVEPVDPLAGRSLLPLARDEATAWPDEAVSEYSSEGVIAPSRMVRRGDWKYVYTRGLAPRLFDLRRDPRELVDRAGQPEVAAIESTLRERLLADWDPGDVDRRVRASQRRRLFLRRLALESGAFPDWNYEARAGDAARFVRPATATGAVGAKPRARFPYVDPTPPDRAAS